MTTRFQRAYGRFVALTDRLGRRLKAWERQLSSTERESGVAALPPEDYVETYKAYRAGMATLIADERDRQKLALLTKNPDGSKPLTEDEYAAAMQELESELLSKASPDALAKALSAKRGRGN